MAGDRSLAFVVIGLIGVTTLWVSNHRRIGPAPSRAVVHVSSAARTSAPQSATGNDGRDARGLAFRMHRHAEAATLLLKSLYPEFAARPAPAHPELGQCVRLTEEAVLTPPLG